METDATGITDETPDERPGRADLLAFVMAVVHYEDALVQLVALPASVRVGDMVPGGGRVESIVAAASLS